MADLFNQQISATYSGLLKTSSSGVLSASLSQISDGRGNTSPLYLSTGSIQFYGAYEFPNSDGSVNQVLKTNGAGVLTWADDNLSNTLNFSGGGSTTGSVTLDTQALAFTGTANQIETSASSQAITLSFPTAGVTLPDGSEATTQSIATASVNGAITSSITVVLDSNVGIIEVGDAVTGIGIVGEVTVATVTDQNNITLSLAQTIANNVVLSFRDNTTKVATTAYVEAAITAIIPPSGDVTKIDPITTNQIAVWNDSTDELRSDPTLSIYEGDNNVPNHSIYLYQPNGENTPVNLYSYNIGGGHLDDVTGIRNTGFGYRNLFTVTTGQENSAFGYESLRRLTSGSYNSAFGINSLNSLTTGNANTAFGWQSLAAITTKTGNTAFGTQVLSNANGTLATEAVNNTGLGSNALYHNTTGSYNVAVGHTALTNVTTGSNNVAIGNTSGSAITTGSNNVTLGGYSNGGSDEGIITLSNGIGTRRISVNNSGKITFYGYGSASPHTGTLAKTLGVDANGNVIEFDAAGGYVTVDGASVVNRVAVWNNTTGELRGTSAIATENSNIYLAQPSTDGTDKFNYIIGGAFAINENDFGIQNTGFGHQVFNSVDFTGNNNTAFGTESQTVITTGASNTSIGFQSMYDNRSGSSNVGLGARTMFNQRISNYNVAIGYDSMDGVTLSQTEISNYNTAVGYQSLQLIQGGDNNTVIGKDSGNAITTGSNNVIIGSFTGFRAAVVGGLPEYSIIASSNNIVLSDGDGNVRQSFDSNGKVFIESQYAGGRLNVKASGTNPYEGINVGSSALDSIYAYVTHNGTQALIGSSGIQNDAAAYTPLSLQTSEVDRLTISTTGLVQVGDGTSQNTFLTTKSSVGWYSGIKLTRGLGDGSSTSNNNFGMLVTDDGWEVATFTSPSNNTTGRSPKLTISSGGLVSIPNGVVFNNNSVTGNKTSVTLNDYEEGTWTSAFQNVTATYSPNTSTYTRIGNVVYFILFIQTTILDTTDTSQIQINLPITAATGNQKHSPVTCFAESTWNIPNNGAGNIVPLVVPATNNLDFYVLNSSTGANYTTLTYTSLGQAAVVRVSGFYYV